MMAKLGSVQREKSIRSSERVVARRSEEPTVRMAAAPSSRFEHDFSRIPTVARVLQTPGRALDAQTRIPLENHLGHDLAHVRIHTDGLAAGAADALHANAFTIGAHVSFAEGRYAPGSEGGRRLLAHELAHVVQQSPGRSAPFVSGVQAEHEADAVSQHGRAPLSARPMSVHLQPAPAATGMSRADLAKKLKAIYGHDITVEVGDKARQTKDLGPPAAKQKLPDDWKEWDPGANAPIYDEILGAFEDFGREVGGVPNIKGIVFYNVRYLYDKDLNVVADTKAGAEIMPKKGIINVYRASLFETPSEESPSTIHYAGIPTPTKRSKPGKKGMAPVVFPPRPESQRRTIAHELGHGVERASGTLADFEKAVGWVDVGGEKRLYDIQAKGVAKAIRDKAAPPDAARIRKEDWNSGKHREQPFSAYAVSDPAEDYAESISAWIYSRKVLEARSPARFKFFNDAEKRKGWLPNLVVPGGATGTTTTP